MGLPQNTTTKLHLTTTQQHGLQELHRPHHQGPREGQEPPQPVHEHQRHRHEAGAGQQHDQGAVHSFVLEETLVYPVLRDRVPEGKNLAHDAYEDHFAVERLLDELLNMKVKDDEAKFDAKMNTMIENLFAHIQHEEGKLLPLLRQYIDPNELVELGGKMESNRPLMPTHPHPNMPKEGVKGMVAGLAAAPLDRAYDTARSAVSGQ